MLTKKQLRKKFPELSNDTLRSLSLVDEEVINYELIEELIKHIVTSTKEGAILCFLPGLMEIQTLYESLNLIDICGFVIASVGVFIATRK